MGGPIWQRTMPRGQTGPLGSEGACGGWRSQREKETGEWKGAPRWWRARFRRVRGPGREERALEAKGGPRGQRGTARGREPSPEGRWESLEG